MRHKLKYIWYFLIVILFIYGIFLPENWQEYFGTLAKPIIYAAHHIPSINKIISSCSKPEYVTGVLGFAAYIPLFFSLFFLLFGPDSTNEDNKKLLEKVGCFHGIFGDVPMTAPCIVGTYIFMACALYFFYMLPFFDAGESLRNILETPNGPRDIILVGRMWAVVASIITGFLSICLASLVAIVVNVFTKLLFK